MKVEYKAGTVASLGIREVSEIEKSFEDCILYEERIYLTQSELERSIDL